MGRKRPSHVRHRTRITTNFDHLAVANGHNHHPKFPSWATEDATNEWNGKGRRTGRYARKVVLVVGAGGSGLDVVTQSRLSSGHAKKLFHSFSGHGKHAPPREVPGGVPTHGRLAVVTTNTSTYSHSEGEQRLRTNLNYLFPIDRQTVSLSPLHPLNALLFIGPPFPIASAPSGVAQTYSRVIQSPDLTWSIPLHITGQKGWNETLARELFLENLTTFEHRLADEGYDVYHLGHRMNVGLHTDVEYQDSLIAYLQSQGLVAPHDRGYIFVEPWGVRGRRKSPELQRIWKEIESRGEYEVKRWLSGVETEEECADLIDRLLEWGQENGIQ